MSSMIKQDKYRMWMQKLCKSKKKSSPLTHWPRLYLLPACGSHHGQREFAAASHSRFAAVGCSWWLFAAAGRCSISMSCTKYARIFTYVASSPFQKHTYIRYYIRYSVPCGQCVKEALRQPGIQSASDFSFLALEYQSEWPVLSLIISSFYQQCTVSVLTVAELAEECRQSRNLEPTICPGGNLNPNPSTDSSAR